MMDSEKMFIIDNDLIDPKMMPQLSDNEVVAIDVFLTQNQRLIENIQLFSIVEFDLSLIRNCFKMYNSDRIERKNVCPKSFDDFISINSLIINYLGACKTLTESISRITISDTCFKKLLNTIYESSFSYRFMYLMRNFSQHGHLPISLKNNRISFDIFQIINTPHYNFNAKLKQELKEIQDEIINKKHDNPNLIVTIQLAEYNIIICELFLKYLSLETEDLTKQACDIEEIIKNHNLQEIGVFLYKESDCIKHFCPTTIDSNDYLQNKICELQNTIEKEKQLLQWLIDGIVVYY